MSYSSITLPSGLDQFAADLLKTIKLVEGYLSEREIKFLILLAACPTTQGEILEIGSFKGKSTIVLAKSAALTERAKVVAVDPLTSPSITDPDLKGDNSSSKDFRDNLRKAGVEELVEFHQTCSYDLAQTWDRPIRLLWIDGDHTYSGTKLDFKLFSEHLANGAIVAIHDVLHEFEGCIRVFLEDILLSSHFGPTGFCGSIGWSQYFSDCSIVRKYQPQKLKLYRRLSPLTPYVTFNQGIKGWTKIKYKLRRARVPHSEINPSKWIQEVVFMN